MGPSPRVSDPGGQGQGLKMSNSNKFPGEAGAAGPGIILWKSWPQSNGQSWTKLLWRDVLKISICVPYVWVVGIFSTYLPPKLRRFPSPFCLFGGQMRTIGISIFQRSRYLDCFEVLDKGEINGDISVFSVLLMKPNSMFLQVAVLRQKKQKKEKKKFLSLWMGFFI